MALKFNLGKSNGWGTTVESTSNGYKATLTVPRFNGKGGTRTIIAWGLEERDARWAAERSAKRSKFSG